MTIDAKQLASDIARVMRAAKDSHAMSSVYAYNIIRRQQDVIRELHKALEVANKRIVFLGHCTSTSRHMDANEEFYGPMFEEALALAEPLLGGE